MAKIPYHQAKPIGRELEYIQKAIEHGKISADGPFTQACNQWLKTWSKSESVYLTHSGTASLEMASLLAEIEVGDEVIMPSFTFSSTANAIVLRGATPVFVDIRPDTLNIDETLIEAAITPKTRAIMVVHYAGVSAEMDRIMAIAKNHNLVVIEDAAQCLLSRYRGQALGGIGHFGCFSFHQTKNIYCGEGGSVHINVEGEWSKRAEIIKDKGTNQADLFRGAIDKYSWVDIGSSFGVSEIGAAYLLAQLEKAVETTKRRREIWNRYYADLASLEDQGLLQRPQVPIECEHNAHIFWVMMRDRDLQQEVLETARDREIGIQFHYYPLHQARAGQKFGRLSGKLSETERAGECLVRLPLWPGVENHIEKITEVFQGLRKPARRAA